jgi:hypothetical protein
LRIGAASARQLVKIVRAEFDKQTCGRLTEADAPFETLLSVGESVQLPHRERV